MNNVRVGMPGKDRRWRRNNPGGMSLNATTFWLGSLLIGVGVAAVLIFTR